jgi:DNA-binding TFAR19-related protein (PDSD5 family)
MQRGFNTMLTEDLPESIVMQKMKKYMKMIAQHQKEAKKEPGEEPEKVVLSKASDEKAVELLEKLKYMYPDIYRVLIPELYKLLNSGVIKEIDSLTVYTIIRRLGLDIKPELRIKFVKHGKEVDFKEYVGD